MYSNMLDMRGALCYYRSVTGLALRLSIRQTVPWRQTYPRRVWNRYGIAHTERLHTAQAELNIVSPRNLRIPRDDESGAKAKFSVMWPEGR